MCSTTPPSWRRRHVGTHPRSPVASVRPGTEDPVSAWCHTTPGNVTETTATDRVRWLPAAEAPRRITLRGTHDWNNVEAAGRTERRRPARRLLGAQRAARGTAGAELSATRRASTAARRDPGRVRTTGEYEEKVRQAVQIGERLGCDLDLRCQLDSQPLGTAADRARHVEPGGDLAASRQHEAPQRLETGVDEVAEALEPGDLLRIDPEALGRVSSAGTERSAPRSKRSFWMRSSHGRYSSDGPAATTAPSAAFSSSTVP